MSNSTSQLPSTQLNTHMKYGNFDVANIDVEEVVNVTILGDVSSSMNEPLPGFNSTKAEVMTSEVKNLIEQLQGWTHHADKIFFSSGIFSSRMEVLTGFQPIANVTPPQFNKVGGMTRLYDATLDFLKNIINQQEKALHAGVQTKSILFVFTDGEDNESDPSSAPEVKRLIEQFNKDERAAGTFGSVLCGIGEPANFEKAQKEMGIQKLFVIDPNWDEDKIKKEMKKLFTFLSMSISSASSTPGGLVNF